ncbi:MAG: hypothetical protein JW754_05460 [Candidatus Aenigmarchaeota archaeon]|nr:hypothetical protein [Candidatus Aenigmarchaeota archaeon]
MDKKQILKELMKHGIAPTPDELNNISRENLSNFLDMKKHDQTDEVSTNIRILKNNGDKTLNSRDFIKKFNEKYETLRDILLKKTDAISINKARKIFAESVVVVRVKDIAREGFVVEDTTGEAEVVSKEDGIEIGDVIAIEGTFRDNRMFPEKIIFPDIPLSNHRDPVDGIDIKFTDKITGSFSGIVISTQAEPPENPENITNIPNPAWLEITSGEKKLVILAFRTGNEITGKDAENILKKRMLPKTNNMDMNNAISYVPDVFWISGNRENWNRNYKGVVIVSTGNSYATYNTTTNKIIFGNL